MSAMPNVSPLEIGVLHELEPVVAANLNRHEATAKLWHPHDFVPWDEGRNFAAMGGEDWDPSQSRLSDDAQMALILNLLTEDNLPSYHHIIAEQFGLDGPWGQWVGRWTAEENRHAIVIRDFLVVTRAVDPVDLEKMRMEHMTRGYKTEREKTPLETLAYVTFQELATRMSHRNTGAICNDPDADRMLARVAADENLHMLFYRNLVEAALEIAPDEMM
ncbi:MAG TPA: acyl-ACP desaturase, partial [Candidatus Pristimantibacillus sp.]|nr:acyl-ACP desaturase [Candidatus Pristimantibacillus sp.]